MTPEQHSQIAAKLQAHGSILIAICRATQDRAALQAEIKDQIAGLERAAEDSGAPDVHATRVMQEMMKVCNAAWLGK